MPGDNHLGAIVHKKPQPSITKNSLKITYIKFHSNNFHCIALLSKIMFALLQREQSVELDLKDNFIFLTENKPYLILSYLIAVCDYFSPGN